MPHPKIDIGSGGADRGEVSVPICFDIGGMHYDPIHVNSLAVSPDGSQVLFTARHLDAVYAIDWASGAIDVEARRHRPTPLAARRLSFEADPFAGPLRPHDVNMLANGNVTMFDNRATIPIATPPGTGPARYVEYEIDTSGGTATLVRSIRRPNGDDSGTMGSARLQPDGPSSIGWGGVPGPVFSEFDADDDLAFEVTFNNFFSYRAIKQPIGAFDLDELRATAGN